MEQEKHTYRIEVKVPRVVPVPRRETTWRTLVPPMPFQEAGDTASYLRESLLAFGFDGISVDLWLQQSVRCVEYKETTERLGWMPMTELPGMH